MAGDVLHPREEASAAVYRHDVSVKLLGAAVSVGQRSFLFAMSHKVLRTSDV